ncbi:nuclear transport factor 2-like isoform X1 [Zingiber officinale]|uniref:nuclear transport factor 2-like isoform X1 n=1 Tax=Zingiber officinale TaxID=94328 RepID=UPI001C4B7CF5|nr:nuclear transport factor 2-like isoform X1 [Zingiber officinale]
MGDQQFGEERPHLSAREVSDNFVPQYYYIMQHSPELLHQFYRDGSWLGWSDAHSALESVNTIDAIDDKVLSTELGRVEIKTVDAQESFEGGVTVLVSGYLIGNDYVKKNFIQSFFLAPQENGFYVLNDVFRVVERESHHQEQQHLPNGACAPLVDDDHDLPSEDVTEDQTVPLPVEDVSNPSENGEIEEVAKPIVDVIVDDANDSQPRLVNSDVEIVPANVIEEATQPQVVDSNVEIAQNVASPEVVKDSQEEAVDSKRSYASIVKLMKEKFSESAPAHAPSKPISIKTEPQATPAPTVAQVSDMPESTSTVADSSKNQEIAEADGHSIYVKNLPLDATPAQLEEVFKKFGRIKPDGIQVRGNKLQGFCFGFVQFEAATAVSSAIEASPVLVGGRQVYVEEKRATGARVTNNRGRFPPGRAFQNNGRGRGNYAGRGYGRVNFNTRSGTDLGGRGAGSGAYLNRGNGLVYQKVASMESNDGSH